MSYFLSLTFLVSFTTASFAQQKWTLPQCVQYAIDNNLTIKQNKLQTTLAELQYKQSKLGQYPNVSFNTGASFNSGRNQDPTTFALITQNYLSANAQLQTSVDIFNFYSKKNTIAANKYELDAAKAGNDKLINDISLAIANAYLQILLAKEQEEITKIQLQQSKLQLDVTRKQVNAGTLPELNASELEAQVARDSANYISAKGTVTQSVLSLKSNMGFDAAAPFEVDTPPVDKIFIEKIGDLQPEAVYALAIANMPQQRVNDFKLKAAEKSTAAAKGNMYPTLSGFGSLSNSYLYARTPIYDRVFSGYTNSGLKANVGGTLYDVQTPNFTTGSRSGYATSSSFGTQINQNFRKGIGINISVPIFNGGSLKTNYERSKVNTQSLQLQKQLDDQKLKQDIYQAYNAAVVALEKYNASVKGVQTAQRSFDFAGKRYAVGLLTTLELTTNQNNLLRAKLEQSLNQFDYVFKMKVLEFYKGMGLKF